MVIFKPYLDFLVSSTRKFNALQIKILYFHKGRRIPYLSLKLAYTFIIMYTEFPNILYPKLINFSKDNIECDFLRIRNRMKFSQGNYPWNVEKKYCRERKAQLEESVKKE